MKTGTQYARQCDITGELITNTNGEQFRVLTVQPDHVTGLQYCKDDTILSPAIKVINLKDIKL